MSNSQPMKFFQTGMTKTETGGNTLAERKTGEVNYYGQGADVPYVYTMNLPRAVGDGTGSARQPIYYALQPL